MSPVQQDKRFVNFIVSFGESKTEMKMDIDAKFVITELPPSVTSNNVVKTFRGNRSEEGI